MRFQEGSVGHDWNKALISTDFRNVNEQGEIGLDKFVRDRVRRICQELFMPDLFEVLTGVSSLLEYRDFGFGYDLNLKYQLARIFNSAAPEGEEVDLFTGKVTSGRIEKTTRLQHEWVTTMYILEFMLESTKYGSQYTKAEWRSAALLGLLHDTLHPNGSHGGERAIAELAKIAGGDLIFWQEWLRAFGLEIYAGANLEVFGKTPEEREKYRSHDSMMLFEMSDEKSGIRTILEAHGVRGEIIELLKQQLAGKGLGEILDYCDTFAYLDLDHVDDKGYPFTFPNGQGILEGLLSSIYYQNGPGWQFVPTNDSENSAARSVVEQTLALRARMTRETYKSTRNSIHEAMLQKMTVMGLLLGQVTLWDIFSGGDVSLLDKLSRFAAIFKRYKRNGKTDTLGPVIDYFYRNAILGKSDFQARWMAIPQDELSFILGNFSLKYDKAGVLSGIRLASGKELELADALSLAVFNGVRRHSPDLRSVASRGAFVVIPPVSATSKKIFIGKTVCMADRRLVYGDPRNFLVAIANPEKSKERDLVFDSIKESVLDLPAILRNY